MVEDIVEEILVRLPAKSLVRCKSLSKDCHNFISRNRAFRERYLRRNKGYSLMLGFFSSIRYGYNHGQHDHVHFLPTTSQGRIRRNTTAKSSPTPTDESLAFLGHDETHILASSNGFLLCCTRVGGCCGSYSICNPMNKEQVVLPPHKVPGSFSQTHGFICHSTSPCIYMVDYYKIVRAIDHRTGLTIEIFSSDRAAWKLIDFACPRRFFVNDGFPSTVIAEKDLIYFPGIIPTAKYFERGVVIFDERKETLQLLLYPRPESEQHNCVDWFGKSDGAILYARHEHWQLKVWMLNCHETTNGHGWEWSLKHNVRIEVPVEIQPKMAYIGYDFEPFRFIAFHPSNPNKIFLDNFRSKVFVYDLESSKLEFNFSMSKAEQGWKLNYYLFPYMYGLIGPHLFIDE